MGNEIKSRRFCLICDKITDFSYDRNITHSRCLGCGSGSGINPNNWILKHFQEKIKALEKEKETNIDYKINKLKEKVEEQRKVIRGLHEKIKIIEKKKGGKDENQ